MAMCFAQKVMSYGVEVAADIYENIDGIGDNLLTISLMNIGDYSINRIRVKFEDYISLIELDEPISVGGIYDFIVYLPNDLNIYGEHIVKLEILSEDGSVVLTDYSNIYLCENNIQVNFEQTILDSRQHFLINIFNYSFINAHCEVNIYVNCELYSVSDFDVKANELIMKDFVLENISYQDHIYFVVKSDIGDRDNSDNRASFYSWRDERLQIKQENKYKDVLDNSKLLLGAF